MLLAIDAVPNEASFTLDRQPGPRRGEAAGHGQQVAEDGAARRLPAGAGARQADRPERLGVHLDPAQEEVARASASVQKRCSDSAMAAGVSATT